MPYVRIADPTWNPHKHGRSMDWKQFRDNQDYHESRINNLTVITDQDIRDAFIQSSGVGGPGWSTVTGGTGSLTLMADHTLELDSNGNGAANFAIIAGNTDKLRIQKAEEYVAYMLVRIKRTGNDNDHYVCGWNDDGLGGGNLATDTTDFVGITRHSGGNWQAKISEGTTAATTSSAFGTGTSWTTLLLEFTCSATAGNRALAVYVNGTLTTTLTTDANMPGEVLRPVVGISGDVGVSAQMMLDYAEFAFRTRPVAA